MKNSDEYDQCYKVVIVGDTRVGKSNLLNVFTEKHFDSESITTIGVEFGVKRLEVEGKNVKAQIWDTAGQERFRAVGKSYYRGSAGALLVYDVTKRSTFTNIETWLADVRHYGDISIAAMLVGNKSDLESLREVSTQEAKQYADENHIIFIETSAKESTNIDVAFINLIAEIYRKQSCKEFSPSLNQQITSPAPINQSTPPKDSTKEDEEFDLVAFKSWMGEVMSRLTAMDTKMDSMNAKLDKIDKLEERLDTFEDSMKDMAGKLTENMKK